MIQKPKWVVFDIGGVLFDFRKSLQDLSKHVKQEEEIITQALFEYIVDGELGLLTFEEAWQKVFLLLNLAYDAKIVARILYGVEYYSLDTLYLMEQLSEKGYKLALFTNNWIGMMEWAEKNIKELNLATQRIESSKLKMRKPDEEIYRYVEKLLKAKNLEIFFIDDSKVNIQTAENIEWQTYHYSLGNDSGKTANDNLRKLLL